jgi:hypothetical protein
MSETEQAANLEIINRGLTALKSIQKMPKISMAVYQQAKRIEAQINEACDRLRAFGHMQELIERVKR